MHSCKQAMTQQTRNQDESLLSENYTPVRPKVEPIEKPGGFKLRLVYWAMRRSLGKVPTSVKVILPHSPKSMGLFTAVGKFEAKGIRLEKDLHYMIAMFVSGINGCGFCLDLGRMIAVKDGMGLEKFNALPAYRTRSSFLRQGTSRSDICGRGDTREASCRWHI